MSGAAHPPRPFATALAIVWERDGRWVIRGRADWLVMRVVAFLVCAMGIAALLVAGGLLLSLGAPILAGLAVVALLLGRAPRAGAEILWEPAQLRVRDRSLPLARIQSVRFLTALNVRRGRHATSAVQVWRLEVQARGVDEPLLLAVHPDEYALLRAGRRLAAVLGVAWQDRCGPVGLADGPPAPRNGGELRFQVRRGGAIAVALGAAAGIAAVALLVPFDRGPREWAPAISLLVLVPAFLGSALAARDHGWFRVVIEGGSAFVHRPLRWPLRLPLEQIREVRLSARLRPSPKPPAAPGVMSVDLLDETGRPLVRLPAAPADAPGLAEGLKNALPGTAP